MLMRAFRDVPAMCIPFAHHVLHMCARVRCLGNISPLSFKDSGQARKLLACRKAIDLVAEAARLAQSAIEVAIPYR
jgi:hypothetical protein